MKLGNLYSTLGLLVVAIAAVDSPVQAQYDICEAYINWEHSNLRGQGWYAANCRVRDPKTGDPIPNTFVGEADVCLGNSPNTAFCGVSDPDPTVTYAQVIVDPRGEWSQCVQLVCTGTFSPQSGVATLITAVRDAPVTEVLDYVPTDIRITCSCYDEGSGP